MAHSLTQAEFEIPSELLALRPPVSHEQFEEICGMYDDLRLELTSTGELIIMPPTGMDTGVRNADLTTQLMIWSKKDGSGLSFGNNVAFTLPNGAIRSPDEAWIRREKWDGLSEHQKQRFGPFCPDFVVELRSQSDRLPVLLNKMSEYMANGASLGWLIDPGRRRVYVYRPDEEVVMLENPASVSGEPLLPGFVLETAELW